MLTFDVTPRQAILRLQRDLQLSVADIAGAVSVSPKSVQRWRSGGSSPRRDAQVRLTALVALNERISETSAIPDAARSWMRSRNRFLGDLSPNEIMRVGRIDSVEAAIEALDSGIFL